jgi:hypothetical protein
MEGKENGVYKKFLIICKSIASPCHYYPSTWEYQNINIVNMNVCTEHWGWRGWLRTLIAVLKLRFAYIDFRLSHYYIEYIGRGELFEVRDLYVLKNISKWANEERRDGTNRKDESYMQILGKISESEYLGLPSGILECNIKVDIEGI